MSMKQGLLVRAVAAAAVVSAVGAAAQPAQAVEFSGQRIELIIPYNEGGGTDVYARLFAPYLEKYLPGKPTIILRNHPGGGSVKGNNLFEARAKPDGLTFVSTSSSSMVSQLFAGKKRKFDMVGWRQFIVSPRGTMVYAATATGAKGMDPVADIKAMKGKDIKYGAKAPNAGELRTILAFELLGMDVKSVFGLARGATRKAMMRGELQINHDTTDTYLTKVAKLEKQGHMVKLFTLGYPLGEKIERDPVFPDVLTVGEVYEKLNGKKPSGPNWRALKAFMAMGVTASKGFALPKGTPDDIYNAYVNAAKKSIEDPDFRKRAEKMLGNYPQVFGKDANDTVNEAVNLPPDIDKWLKNYLRTKFNVKI